MRKRDANRSFRLICLVFAALLAVLALYTGAEATARADENRACSEEISRLQAENESLRVRAACRMSLEELEDYAIRVLGLQYCRSEQIETISLGEAEGEG